MTDHDHHHDSTQAASRRVLGIRFGKKPKPKPQGATGPDGLSVGGTPVGCCGSCVGAKPVR